MRLLHLIPSAGGGGAERQLGLLAAAQARRGDQVHLGVLEGGVNLARYRESGAEVHLLRGGGAWHPRQLAAVLRLVRRLRPQLVQTWIPRMDVLGGVAARLAGVPWVVAERTWPPAYQPTAAWRLRALVTRGADAVVANSLAGVEYWRARLPRRPVALVRNALPLDEIDQAPAAPRPDALPRLLYVGRLAEEKNLGVLAAAVRQVARERPLRLLVCGEGPGRAPLAAALVGAPGVTLELLGYHPAVWSLMKSADALLSASRVEGNPNAVLEAMACGCPVVVSGIAAHREVVDADSGWVAAGDDAAGFAAALAARLADPAAALRRAAEARRRVEGLGAARAAERYEQVYLQLGGTALRRAAAQEARS